MWAIPRDWRLSGCLASPLAGKEKIDLILFFCKVDIEMIDELYSREVIQACKGFRVKSLHVFGSFAEGQSNVSSDIDFIVEFERDGYSGAFEQFMGFKERLESVLGRPVDLLVNRQFRNEVFREEVERTKKLVYAA